MEKILEKSGNFVSPEKWEPCVITENCTKFTTLRISDTYMLSKTSTESWVAQWGPSVGQVEVVIIQGEVCCPSEKENRLNLQEPTRRLSKNRYIVDDVALD